MGDFLAPRFNSDGTQDSGFGAGFINGAPVTNLGADNDGFEVGRDLAIQPDGKIVVVGEVVITVGSTQFPQPSVRTMGIVHYNANGSLDTSFSDDGFRLIGFGDINSDAEGVVILPDDGIAVAGVAGAGANANFAVARLTSTGALDTSFSGDGVLTTPVGKADDFGNAIAVQRNNGRIVVAGTALVRNTAGNITDSQFALTRYTPIPARAPMQPGLERRATTPCSGRSSWALTVR